MRFIVVCIFGSAVVSPFRCGESPEPASPVPAETGATVTKTGIVGTGGERSSASPRNTGTPADPLVPPIDLGGNPQNPNRLLTSDFSEFDFTSGDRAVFHAHGEQVCASGCAASRHPTGTLSQAKYHWLLRRFAEQPMDETSPALESLLYYGRQTSLWMQRQGTGKLSKSRVDFVRRELKKTHVILRFRIVDEHDVVRVSIPPTRVPLDRRHVFKMDTKNLPALITSGTVKRVGLHHLWTRL